MFPFLIWQLAQALSLKALSQPHQIRLLHLLQPKVQLVMPSRHMFLTTNRLQRNQSVTMLQQTPIGSSNQHELSCIPGYISTTLQRLRTMRCVAELVLKVVWESAHLCSSLTPRTRTLIQQLIRTPIFSATRWTCETGCCTCVLSCRSNQVINDD